MRSARCRALFGHEAVLERAAALARNERSARAVANLAEVYRLLTIYGLADAVLLDLGEVRGFDYYSGTYFEAYVGGFGASVAGGGRYDHMLGRFGYECPAVGFAFDVARMLAVMEAQAIAVPLAGPDFFIIDFTPEKTVALSLARRLRDRGASVARDIISRGLEESIAYARAQRVSHVLVVGSPRTKTGEMLALDLASGVERALPVGRGAGTSGAAFSRSRRRGQSCLTSWWSVRSGVTRARARWWTSSPRTSTSSSAIRAATTPATRSSSAARSTSCTPSPRGSCTRTAAA